MNRRNFLGLPALFAFPTIKSESTNKRLRRFNKALNGEYYTSEVISIDQVKVGDLISLNMRSIHEHENLLNKDSGAYRAIAVEKIKGNKIFGKHCTLLMPSLDNPDKLVFINFLKNFPQTIWFE